MIERLLPNFQEDNDPRDHYFMDAETENALRNNKMRIDLKSKRPVIEERLNDQNVISVLKQMKNELFEKSIGSEVTAKQLQAVHHVAMQDLVEIENAIDSLTEYVKFDGTFADLKVIEPEMYERLIDIISGER